MKKESYFCDLCEKEIAKTKKDQLQVIFTTEQTEGRPVDHRFTREEILNQLTND